MPELFDSLTIGDVTIKNRIGVSPMCQYSADNGLINDWHLVHYGSFAIGGAGLIIAEATAVEPEGRISDRDAGIWNEELVKAWSKVTSFIKQNGSVPAIQLAHAGRKASCSAPPKSGKQLELSEGGWQTVSSSPLPFLENDRPPIELSTDNIKSLNNKWVAAAKNAIKAGFEIIELHMAHGYFMHQFLSPLTNKRTDEYGGTLENRMRFPIEVTRSIREVLPDGFPFFVRLSCSDWVEEGWGLEDSIIFASILKEIGVDLIDCSSGGIAPKIRIPVEKNYQLNFAETIKKEAKIETATVGLITETKQASSIIQNDQADMVLLGRELLRNPRWTQKAAKELGVDISWPIQYQRAKS